MGQERLSSFTLLSIERVLNESIDFTPVIDKFATLNRGSNFPLYIGQNPWTPKNIFRSLRSLVYGILVHIINYVLLTVFFLGGAAFLTFAPSGTLPRYATELTLKQFFQTFSSTSDEVIDISCDPYIEAIHDLNSINLDIHVLQSIVFIGGYAVYSYLKTTSCHYCIQLLIEN